MWALPTLLIEVWFGFECSLALFSRHLSFFPMVGAAVPVGVSLSTIAFFLMSPILGHGRVHLLCHTVGLIVLSVVLFNRRLRSGRVYTLRMLKTAMYSLLMAVALIFIIPSHVTTSGDFESISIPYQHEDISLFYSLECGVNSNGYSLRGLKHPDRYGCVAVTRWFTAYHASMLACGGSSMKVTFFFTSLEYLCSLLMLISAFGEEFELSCFVCPFCVTFPIFCSGNGFLEFLASERYLMRLTDFISNMGSGFPDPHRLNPLFHIVLGNREMMFATATAALCLILLFKLTFVRGRSEMLLISSVCGFLIGGVLPMVQHQTFFALVVFSCAHVLVQSFRQHFSVQARYLLVSIAVPFVILNLVRYCDREFLQSAFQFERQWQREIDAGSPFPVLSHIWHIGGIFPFLVFVSLFFIGSVERDFLTASLISFVIFGYWKTQYLLEHNIFAFYPIFVIPGSVSIFVTFVYLYRRELNAPRKGILAGISMVLVLLANLSGILGTRVLMKWDATYSKNEFEMGAWIVANTPPDAVFYYPGNFLNFMSATTGRQMYCLNQTVALYTNFPPDRCNSASITSLPIQYVIFDGKETLPYNFDRGWRLIHSVGSIRLFQKKS